MNALWSYFWPVFGVGLVFGILAGPIAFRVRILRSRDRPNEPTLIGQPRRKRIFLLAGGVAAAVIAAVLWHGPLGAADRFSAEVERNARLTLNDWEMTQVNAHLHRGPLTRTLILSGPANDFQTARLVEIMSALPGVSRARWTDKSAGSPLILEGTALALIGFLFGLLVAYLVELRRRYNSQWNW